MKNHDQENPQDYIIPKNTYVTKYKYSIDFQTTPAVITPILTYSKRIKRAT